METQMRKPENGEVMLEGMIVVIITMFMLIWVLAIGFVYYQRYVIATSTNDAAAKVAATYNNPSSDLMMGYIECSQMSSRDLYRGFKNNALFDVNKNKAEAYVNYMLKKTNFAGTVDDVKVTLKLVNDSALRKHITVEATCTMNTPFGKILDFFGLSGKQTYTTSGSADCTDICDYISTIDFAAYQLGGSGVKSSVISLVNSLVSVFNHRYAN